MPKKEMPVLEVHIWTKSTHHRLRNVVYTRIREQEISKLETKVLHLQKHLLEDYNRWRNFENSLSIQYKDYRKQKSKVNPFEQRLGRLYYVGVNSIIV